MPKNGGDFVSTLISSVKLVVFRKCIALEDGAKKNNAAGLLTTGTGWRRIIFTRLFAP
jgi:hypothetical protein